MGKYGWATENDTILKDGSADGWDDRSGKAYKVRSGRNHDGTFQKCSYKFGRLRKRIGTWGQLIFSSGKFLDPPELSNPSGLNGRMPTSPSPDGSKWIQGHLINGQCGGRSGDAYTCNLTPISHNLNRLHSGCETTLQLLANRGRSAGLSVKNFNPNSIDYSWVIYRTHALEPEAGKDYPSGILVSLGIVIGNDLKSIGQVRNHFHSPGSNKWFSDSMYGNKKQQHDICELINGFRLTYPD